MKIGTMLKYGYWYHRLWHWFTIAWAGYRLEAIAIKPRMDEVSYTTIRGISSLLL